MVIRLFAVSAEYFVAVVVAVVARTPVVGVLGVVVLARRLWLLTLVAIVVVRIVVGFAIPVGALILRTELYGLNVILLFFNC